MLWARADLAENGDVEMTSASQRAVLFADVSGSTRLYERLGDRVALALRLSMGQSRKWMQGGTRRCYSPT